MAAAEQAALDASPESLRQEVAEAKAKAAEVRKTKTALRLKGIKRFSGRRFIFKRFVQI
eukprot:COSAG06_NODE_2456_length_6848_cov_66.970959_2_plen_59_part_00